MKFSHYHIIINQERGLLLMLVRWKDWRMYTWVLALSKPMLFKVTTGKGQVFDLLTTINMAG